MKEQRSERPRLEQAWLFLHWYNSRQLADADATDFYLDCFDSSTANITGPASFATNRFTHRDQLRRPADEHTIAPRSAAWYCFMNVLSICHFDNHHRPRFISVRPPQNADGPTGNESTQLLFFVIKLCRLMVFDLLAFHSLSHLEAVSIR